ncbi:hypothetical protein KC347_g259 [Hortaea werneckii]|nr:hypothetical protein KC347_g259 [Hortaea werneckii]
MLTFPRRSDLSAYPYPAAYREMWRGVAITEEPRNEMRAEILENTWDCHPQRSNDAHDSGGPISRTFALIAARLPHAPQVTPDSEASLTGVRLSKTPSSQWRAGSPAWLEEVHDALTGLRAVKSTWLRGNPCATSMICISTLLLCETECMQTWVRRTSPAGPS